MSLTAITLQNFKGIRDPVRIELKPITLLFGPNSAGKSTIIQAIHYTREILERNNLNADRTLYGGEVINLGGFKNLVYQYNLNLPIVMQFDFDLSNVDLPEYSDQYLEINLSETIETAWIKLTLKWHEPSQQVVLTAYEVGINGIDIAKIITSEEGQNHSLQGKLNHPLVLSFFSYDIEKYIEEHNQIIDGWVKVAALNFGALPKWGKSFEIIETELASIFGEEGRIYSEYLLSQVTVGPGEMLRNMLRQFRYVGPIRKIPPRNFDPTLSPDEASWANGMAAWNTLYRKDHTFLEEVSQWMAEDNRLNTGYRLQMNRYVEIFDNYTLDVYAFELVQGLPFHHRLVLVEKNKGLEVLPQDIGVGISQLLPVVVAALDTTSTEIFEYIVAIEQPELHIHPAIQVALGDIFISQINKTDMIFMLETHSENLLLRLLRRIRETNDNELPTEELKLQPEQISVIYVEQQDEGMKLSPLRVDETGEFIDFWPKGFFEERAEELF
ncbi:MAG: DUF3696 domain-containing protein [Candidatus Parabeggiatoa sp.]|nr:DUF3696 domain-containing protein [Candidatus Parabeggiatoa sp.]